MKHDERARELLVATARAFQPKPIALAIGLAFPNPSRHALDVIAAARFARRVLA